ncbi:hypothetical protein P9314_26440 [Paenibacillus validus]|uniref:Uncharacterized protein n=1 Tax=Paenibacillus validus TaxID=44253 RepID=A0A7X2ZCS2_9BACL|nr:MULTISPECIES: hypothetical protein [Paenibacillus]MED4604171.1 hypothetical protein [Paenibacillus validus]MED4609851.1 hypothetical protein [Paenibacillus validus]MUG71915.1 hypothetical protein [Paenibacillus validus]
MAKQNVKVPFGYEPPKSRESERGSLWVYDSFADYSLQELQPLLRLAEERSIAKLVFYPLHEETVRRMEKEPVEPYYRRVDALEALLDEAESGVDWTIERFEGKRKKYTPMDTAFRFLEEKYASPYFVYVSAAMAGRLAGYESFEPWIKKVRMFIAGGSGEFYSAHPMLQKHSNRWERV